MKTFRMLVLVWCTLGLIVSAHAEPRAKKVRKDKPTPIVAVVMYQLETGAYEKQKWQQIRIGSTQQRTYVDIFVPSKPNDKPYAALHVMLTKPGETPQDGSSKLTRVIFDDHIGPTGAHTYRLTFMNDKRLEGDQFDIYFCADGTRSLVAAAATVDQR